MLVIIESPYAGDIKTNIEYAKACVRDSLMRGEFPFASHLLYAQDGILNDNNPNERTLGINVGLEWAKHAVKTIVFTNLGITKGMKIGIENAKKHGREIEYRKIKWKE